MNHHGIFIVQAHREPGELLSRSPQHAGPLVGPGNRENHLRLEVHRDHVCRFLVAVGVRPRLGVHLGVVEVHLHHRDAMVVLGSPVVIVSASRLHTRGAPISKGNMCQPMPGLGFVVWRLVRLSQPSRFPHHVVLYCLCRPSADVCLQLLLRETGRWGSHLFILSLALYPMACCRGFREARIRQPVWLGWLAWLHAPSHLWLFRR